MTTPPIPPQPQPPVKKKSARRSLAAKLPVQLADSVETSMNERATITLRNAKRVQLVAAIKAIQTGGSLDAPTEGNKLLALTINQTLKTNQARQQKLKANRGVPLSGASRLTQDGKNSVKDTVSELTAADDREFAMPFGTRRGGVSTTSGEVQAINPGLKVGEQVLQLLGHLAQLFMNTNSDMEYQVLLVNDRLLVASNAQEKISSFAGKDLQSMLSAAAKTPATLTPDGASDKVRAYRVGALAEALRAKSAGAAVPLTTQLRDGAALLAELEVGYHMDHSARPALASLLSVVQHQALNQVVMHGPVTPDGAVALIGDPNFTNSVILVKPSVKSGWHAEQALVSALVKAGWTRGAAVGGTKLPCFCCWLTLSLVNQCGYPLGFVPTPGFLWESTTLAGLTSVAQQLHVSDVTSLLSQFRTAQSMTGDGFGQFMTALKEQSNLTVDTSLSGKKMGEKGLTQNQSQKSFNFGHYAPTPVDLPGEAPGSPVGTYGTPPSSPGGQADETMETEYKSDYQEYEKNYAAWRKDQEMTDQKKKTDS